MKACIFTVLISFSLTTAALANVYVPLPVSSIFNRPSSFLINGSTYPQGAQSLGGVPFNLGNSASYCWDGGWASDNNVHTATIPLSVPNVARVYTAINTAAGAPGPNSYLSVQFNGSAGAQATFNLIGGVDIRDYNQSTYTNTINNTTTINVFTNGQGQRMDRQVFNLPAAFLAQSLVSIVITDSGRSSGSPLQRGIFWGATAEQVPEPATLSVLGLGGIALFRRRARRPG